MPIWAKWATQMKVMRAWWGQRPPCYRCYPCNQWMEHRPKAAIFKRSQKPLLVENFQFLNVGNLTHTHTHCRPNQTPVGVRHHWGLPSPPPTQTQSGAGTTVRSGFRLASRAPQVPWPGPTLPVLFLSVPPSTGSQPGRPSPTPTAPGRALLPCDAGSAPLELYSFEVHA